MRAAFINMWIAGVLAGGAWAAGQAESPVQAARVSLERARSAQADVLKNMTELLSRRQGPGAVELISGLTQIYQMQLAVLQRTRSMVPATFGRSVDALNEAERQSNERLAVDQRSVRQRLGDWVTAFTRFAAEPNSGEGVRRLQSQAANSTAGDLMEQSAEHITVNHLADAVTVEQQAADAILRLIQSIEALTIDPEQVRQKRLRELMDILELEKTTRAHLKPPPASDQAWQQVRREQDAAAERTRPMTFEESGMAPNVLERVRAALAAMQMVQSSLRPTLRLSKFPQAQKAADDAIAILNQAIEFLQSTAEGADPDLLPSTVINKNPGPPNSVQMSPDGTGVPLPDMTAMAQLAADISLVTKMLRAEKKLRAEIVGSVPPMPSPAERQTTLANQLPQVIRRVTACVPQAGTALEQARIAMSDAADRLRATDNKTAADHQAKAIEQLTDAEGRMQRFWVQLLEALSKISAGAPGVAPGAGASDKENVKAQMEMLLKLLPELVRLGELVTNLQELIAQTSAWTSTAPAESQASVVADVAKKQRDLAATGLDIANKMSELGERVSGDVPGTIRDAVDFMNGAASALDDADFEKANGRQVDALDKLQRALTTVASQMASIQQNLLGSTPGQGGANTGSSGGTSETVTNDPKTWSLSLPPQARAAYDQSQAEPFPPQYEPAVKRYYERLSNRKAPR